MDDAEKIIESIIYRTIDPTVNLDGKQVPALTTLLHGVCKGDPSTFDEAIRVVELFLREALR